MSKEINFGNTKGARMAKGEKLTNFEKIKLKSVDEMAEFLEDDDYICMQYCNQKHCAEHKDDGKCAAAGKEGRKNACVQAVKNWLNSEVSDNG